MDARGYRAQAQPQDQATEVPATPSSVSPRTLGLGALAVVATAVTILFVMRLDSSSTDKPAQPAGAETSNPDSQLAGQPVTYGPAGAPVQVMAMPGTCEGHTQMVANLKALSEEYPDELHVDVLPMGHSKAAAEGFTCAAYLMKIEGRLEPNATPGGYVLLAEKGPGQNWTPESVTEQIQQALDEVRKARGKKQGSPKQSESPAKADAGARAVPGPAEPANQDDGPTGARPGHRKRTP